MARKPPPLVLTNPTTLRPTCPACGKEVRNLGRHGGTSACANAARRAMIDRLGLVEVWRHEREILAQAHVPVTVIAEKKDGKDRRHWYAAPGPVSDLRALWAANVPADRIGPLLRGPVEVRERELAVAALRGPPASVEFPPLWHATTQRSP